MLGNILIKGFWGK